MRLLALLGLLGLLLACDPGPQPASSGPTWLPVPIGAAPVQGPADAWVTVVVFSDLECPFCAQEHSRLLQLLAIYPGDVRLAWKHFPLTSIHAHARGAAIAAECAKEQGRFWEMTDLVFANRTQLGAASLASYAGQTGLDTTAWSTCIGSSAAAAAVDADVALGIQLGVPATPTMAVNGRPLVGAYSLAALQAQVEAARTAAVASGIPRADYYGRAVLGQ